MPARRRRLERRKKQLGEVIHFETEKQYVMVSPEEFAQIVGKPGLVTYVKDGNHVFRVGNDKEIVVKHMGKRAVVFEERRMQPGGIAAKVKPLIPPRKGKASPQKPSTTLRILRSRGMPEDAADKIVRSLQSTEQKKSKGK